MSQRISVFIATVVLAATLSAPFTVHAESVRTLARSGEEGHAWLFGAPGQSGIECWLAFPIHILGASEAEQGTPFEFEDKDGNRGEAGSPVGISNVPDALEATNGFDDLGFARVVAGREGDDCLSRLGLDSLAYRGVLRSRVSLLLENLFPTSFGVFTVYVARAGVGDLAYKLELATEDKAASLSNFKGGLSGAVAELVRDTGNYPVAMITDVDPNRDTAWALRFDAIAKAFPSVRAAIETREGGEVNKEDRGLLGFPVASYQAITISKDEGPASLSDDATCWRAVPPGGQSVVSLTSRSLTIETTEATVLLGRALACGDGAVPFSIDVSRDRGKTWTRTSDCLLAAEQSSVACPLNRRGELRIRVEFRTQKLGLSTIYIQ